MHSNNSYLLRAQMAERELDIAIRKGRQLFSDTVVLQRNHVLALRVVDEMGATMQSRRHRLASWIGRIIGGSEMTPGALVAMLIGVRAALSNLPAPGIVEPAASESSDA